jgi:NADPH-dependent curcumin reductase
MVGGTVGEVIESSDPALKPGDVVAAYTGWQQYGVTTAGAVRRLDPAQAPVTTALGVLGMPGFTAYAGLTQIGVAGRFRLVFFRPTRHSRKSLGVLSGHIWS